MRSVKPSTSERAFSSGAGGCRSKRAPCADASCKGRDSREQGLGSAGVGGQPGGCLELSVRNHRSGSSGLLAPMASRSPGVRLKRASVFWVTEVAEERWTRPGGCRVSVFLWERFLCTNWFSLGISAHPRSPRIPGIGTVVNSLVPAPTAVSLEEK